MEKPRVAVNLDKKIETHHEESKVRHTTIEFLFAPHNTPADFDGLPERLAEADVYVPEFIAWNHDDLDYFQSVASGDVDPKDYGKKPSYVRADTAVMTELQALYASGKEVMFADVSEDDPLMDTYTEGAEQLKVAFEQFRSGNFEDAISTARLAMKKVGEFHDKRELLMQRNITDRIEEAGDDAPDRVLISLGTGHTKVGHKLKQDRWPIRRSFRNNFTVFSSYEEIIRRHLFDKPVDDDLLAKMFVEQTVKGAIQHLTVDTNLVHIAVRKISRTIDVRAAAFISKDIGQLPEGQKDKQIEFNLARFQIRIPRTTEQLERLAS